ncbi:MAG: hypothetical protein HY393_00650 [Candidatus Diapherotrites archaeon]|nr:hypothetical protein [Candidatus Diapherotrites archaeon]
MAESKLKENWKILVFLAVLLAAFGLIAFKGLQFGVDFSGGTLFQIQLADPATPEQMREQVLPIIQKRLDFTGLKDTTVNAVGNQFVTAQIAETNPQQIALLQELLLKQGKFEALFEGQLIFQGEDILQVLKDATQGYGVQTTSNGSEWRLPFALSDAAAKSFAEKTFHQCTRTSFSPSGQAEYDCKRTYFFIDRPIHVLLVISQQQLDQDGLELQKGNAQESIPSGTKVQELLDNASVAYMVVAGSTLSEKNLATLNALPSTIKTALVSPGVDEGIKTQLSAYNLKVKELPQGALPWAWQALGVKEIISLTPSVTNLEPFVENVQDAKTFSTLVIQGGAPDTKTAQQRLKDLTILLESGSLPIPIESISTQTVSPVLGQDFLFNVAFMGVIAVIMVALVLFIRYRNSKIALPILVNSLSEGIMVLGFASLISWKLDLASMAGIIAAVGTGVNDIIVITDELIRGKEESMEATTTLAARVKRAFFIVTAAAATIIATLLPIIIVGLGLGKLTGFAITTIAGVVLGIFITRPAFAEFIRRILAKEPEN